VRAAVVTRLARLSGMGPAELGYRTAERLRRALDRAGRVIASRERPRLRPLARGAAAELPRDLERTIAARFYPAFAEGEREAIRRAVLAAVPGGAAAVAAEAERLAAHRFEILGFGEIDCGTRVDWHRDPVAGVRWPVGPWTRYDLVHGALADPKPLLELNRHQHVARLARAAFLLDEERFAAAAVALLLSWIEQNPAGRGVHWHSSLEIALRSISWLWALAFLAGRPSLDAAAARRLGGSLFAQLEQVRRYPSVYSSPNTHLVGEATALFLAGTLFAASPCASLWRQRGAELLFGEIDRQVGEDGVHAELSAGYHAYALDFYLQALALAERNGLEVPERARRRIAGMLDALLQLAAPAGTLPALGDDDGGRALPVAEGSYRDARDLLATGAALFGRGDWKRQAGAFPESARWLTGAAGARRFAELPPAIPGALAASFPEGGYHVQRSGWHRDAAHLVFDCGGLGRFGGGHGHADALAITLSAHGAELLVDSGTFVYGGDRAWRDHFRSTAAHNTVRIDGRDQSAPDGTFRWSRAAGARLLERRTLDGCEYLCGEHDGYLAPPVEVVHRRRILYVRPDYWVVIDDFRGRGEHELELLFHAPPEAELAPEPDPERARGLRFRLRNGGAELGVAVHGTTAVEALLEAAGGWVSRRYGERRPAPLAAVRTRAAMPAALLTVLAPAATASRAPRWRVEPLAVGRGAAPDALAAAIHAGTRRDLLLFSASGGAIETGAARGVGELFWIRSEAGRPRRLAAIRAREVELHGEAAVVSAAFAAEGGGAGARGGPHVRHRRNP
jgi:hypothetical protein